MATRLLLLVIARDARWLWAVGSLVLQSGLGAVAPYGGLVASRLV